MLAEGDLDALSGERLVRRLDQFVGHDAAKHRLLDPAQQFVVDGRGAEGAEPYARFGLFAHFGVVRGDLELDRFDVVHVAAVGDPDAHPDPVLDVGPTAFVVDLRVPHHRVGDRDLDVVAGQQTGAADADLGDHAALAAVEGDEVADLVGPVREDEDAREQVRQRVARREADRQAGDAARRQEPRDVGAPGVDHQVGPQDHDRDLGQVLEQGLGVPGDESALAPAPRQRP